MQYDTDPAIQGKAEEVIKVLLGLIREGHSLVLTLSGGKDSLTTTACGLEAIRRAKKEVLI